MMKSGYLLMVCPSDPRESPIVFATTENIDVAEAWGKQPYNEEEESAYIYEKVLVVSSESEIRLVKKLRKAKMLEL